ncbi:hypothetical protein [Streptomyces carminius]|nr:hypothetical protein [Streptomyces carminius]
MARWTELPGAAATLFRLLDPGWTVIKISGFSQVVVVPSMFRFNV